MGDRSINITEVADSVRNEFKALYPLLDECSIYRVPERLRRLNDKAYTPQVVSIGPLHHGKQEFQAIEEHKRRYLQDFLQRTKVSMERFLEIILDRETKIRNCYAEPLSLGSVHLAKMVLADAAFIFEFLLRYSFYTLRKHNDPIFNRWSIIDVTLDLWLLENQLPFFVLRELFDLAHIDTSFAGNEKVTMITLTQKFSTFISQSFSIEHKFDENIFSSVEHFVDVMKVCLQPPYSVQNPNGLRILKAPSATELHHAGVKFVVRSSSKNLMEIKFDKGVLEIPRLRIVKASEPLLRNAMAFEQRRSRHTYITDYVNMIELLVISPKDVELLVRHEIIENWLSGGEPVSSLFHNLIKETPTDLGDFYFSSVINDLNSYCKDPWHQWKATLKEEYFKTPWAVVSIIAAVILLVLSFIQAVCSVLQVVLM
ncbi:hypothetical protein ACOSQ4_017395 [Xanthoceras sorbifolium]